MLEATALAPGSFCWIELATSNQNAAQQFYSTMFSWSATDDPIGPGQFYTTFRLDGESAAAAYTLQPNMVAAGVPPHWLLYIAVTDVDATADRVSALGGKLVSPPFDVMDYGRMVVVADPAGASFALWQARTHPGFTVEGEENAFCWADLSTPDPRRAKPFYEDLLGWDIEAAQNDSSGYLHIRNGKSFIGGIPPVRARAPHAPAHWLIYFQTADCDGCATKAEEHGATIHMPPMSLPNVGRIAIIGDPQGAVFALFEPQTAA